MACTLASIGRCIWSRGNQSTRHSQSWWHDCSNDRSQRHYCSETSYRHNLAPSSKIESNIAPLWNIIRGFRDLLCGLTRPQNPDICIDKQRLFDDMLNMERQPVPKMVTKSSRRLFVDSMADLRLPPIDTSSQQCQNFTTFLYPDDSGNSSVSCRLASANETGDPSEATPDSVYMTASTATISPWTKDNHTTMVYQEKSINRPLEIPDVVESNAFSQYGEFESVIITSAKRDQKSDPSAASSGSSQIDECYGSPRKAPQFAPYPVTPEISSACRLTRRNERAWSLKTTPFFFCHIRHIFSAQSREFSGRCPSCYEKIKWHEWTIQMPCGHYFHADCIQLQVEKTGMCPYCQQPAAASFP